MIPPLVISFFYFRLHRVLRLFSDIMSADRQLANEIEFDLQKFEEQQEELERQRLEQLRRRSRGAPVRTLLLCVALSQGFPLGLGKWEGIFQSEKI